MPLLRGPTKIDGFVIDPIDNITLQSRSERILPYDATTGSTGYAIRQDVAVLLLAQAHKPHQSTNARVVHDIPLVPQVPCHLLDAAKRCLKELLVDHDHEIKVHSRLAAQLLAERRPCDRQQTALRPNGQA